MAQSQANKEIYYKELEDPRWIAKSKEIKAKFGWKCQKCGAIDKPLHCHHKFYVNDDDGRRSPWEYPDETFQVLCCDCHHSFHAELNKERELAHEKFLLDQKVEYENKRNAELIGNESNICLYCGTNGSGWCVTEDGHKFETEIGIENGVCQNCQSKGKIPLDIICKQCNGFSNKIYGCMFHLAPMIKPFILQGFCSVCIYNSHKLWLDSRLYTSTDKYKHEKRKDFINFFTSIGVVSIRDQNENSKELPWYIFDRDKARLHKNSHGIIAPRCETQNH